MFPSLRLQYTFRSFLQIWIFGSKYWSKWFHFFAGSKNLFLDWQSYDVINQPRRLSRDTHTYVKNWLLCYSIDQLPSIFLDVTLLRMNVRGPVRRSERNEPKMKIQQWANKRKLAESWSYGYGITGIKPEKDRIKSWEKRCNDSTCSFWLAYLFLSNPACSCPTYQPKSFRRICHKWTKKFLPFRMKEWLVDCCLDVCSYYKYGSDIRLLSSSRSLCCLPHFSTASRKKTSSKEILSALKIRVTRVNFTTWLSYLRNQLIVFVCVVCFRSKQIFSALFSRNNFLTRRRHSKELNGIFRLLSNLDSS